MFSTDAEAEPLVYAGWVPTVNGRLSFRHVGESRHPTESIYANITTNDARHILGYQRRLLSDSLFQPLTDYLFGSSGDFWFALNAESAKSPVDGDEILGTIYIFKSRDDWRKKADSSIQSAVRRLNDLRFSLDPTRQDEINAVCARANGVLASTADISVKFQLRREGEAYFSSPKFLDPELEYASVNYAQSDGQNFSKWVADQCYFYLRDICHRHQHHANSEDTIIILQVLDDDDVKWRRAIIFSLYFYIIRAKRSDQFPSLIRALGVLAYCRSFKRISAPKFRKLKFDMPHFNDMALTQSLQARIDEDAWRRETAEANEIRRATTSTNYRMLILTAVLIVLALMAIFAPDLDSYPPIEEFSQTIKPMFFPALKLMGVIVVFGFVVTSTRILGWKDVLELSNVYRKRATMVYLVLSVVAMAYVLWQAFGPITELISMFP